MSTQQEAEMKDVAEADRRLVGWLKERTDGLLRVVDAMAREAG